MIHHLCPSLRACQRLATSFGFGLALGLAAALPAQASSNLVLNSSFENGLAGWSVSGNVVAIEGTAVDGIQSAWLADADASISWTLDSPVAVDSLADFSLSLWTPGTNGVTLVSFAYSDGSSGMALLDSFDSTQLVTVSLLADLDAGQSLVGFTLYGNSEAATYVDAVSLTTAVPEPTATLLLLAGLPLVGAARRRRR